MQKQNNTTKLTTLKSSKYFNHTTRYTKRKKTPTQNATLKAYRILLILHIIQKQ